MRVDPDFDAAFRGKIHQAFFYIVDRCNLHCDQCLYKQELTFQMGDVDMPYQRAVNLMDRLHGLGAMKMTFMGGEPTLHHQLPDLIQAARDIGYDYVRIDTNGLFSPRLLEDPRMRKLDEITFSLDGPTPELNDALRGPGVFRRTTSAIRKAVELGYNVQITTCVHNGLTRANGSEPPLMQMVELAKELGVRALNMHDLFKAGIPRDTFSGDHGTTVEEYMSAFVKVAEKYPAKSADGFAVRMPQCVTTKERFESDPAYYGYCSVKQMDRILAFPNGQLRVCSLMIGSPYCIGYYDDEQVYLNKTPTNETRDHEMDRYTPCTNQSKGRHFGKFIPLCVSFKPQQDEIVWIKRHKWEERRGSGPARTHLKIVNVPS